MYFVLGYLSREQYIREPLIKGPYYDSQVVGVDSKTSYRKDKSEYVPFTQVDKYQFDKETFFPRIYSQDGSHQAYYRSYLNLKEGQQPTFSDNLSSFQFSVGRYVYPVFLMEFCW